MPLDGVLSLPFNLAKNATIGLILFASDQIIEHEFRHLIRNDGITAYQGRLLSDNRITAGNAVIISGTALRAMGVVAEI